MSEPTDKNSQTARPFLLRFLQPLERPPGTIAYDRVAQVNVLAGQGRPAVRVGLDLKTLGAVAED